MLNTMRKVLCFLMAMMLAAFALPSSAADSPEKIFSLNMGPASVPTGSATLTATFKNATPSGNSTINSLILTAPAGLTITAATPQNGTAVIASGGGTVSVSNLSGVRPGKTFSLTVTVTVPAACTSYTWDGQAFTGNSLGGDTFRLLGTPPSSLTTSVTSACALRFVSGRNPQDALTNAVITSVDDDPLGSPIQVELSDGSVRVTSFTGTVTLAKAAGSASGLVSGGSAAAAAGVATFPALKIDATGVYSLTASSPGVVSSAPSPTFTIFDGVLFCDDPLGALFVNPGSKPFGETGFVEGKRGKYNKDGSPCIKVAYDFNNDIVNNNTVSLKWDTGSQPFATFSYTATWKDEAVDPSTGLPNRRTKVGFQFDGSGNPIYNFGVACVSSNLPAPYGKLVGSIGVVETLITIDTTGGVATLPTVSFPLVIGTERMTATPTATSGVYTVTRGDGGTTVAPHDANDGLVMSTPLPIDPNATLADGTTPNNFQGKQVPMCIYDEGWMAVGGGKVRFTTSVFDIGDGYVSRQ